MGVRKIIYKMSFANGICIYIWCQWNKPLYVNDFLHWQDNSYFHDAADAVRVKLHRARGFNTPSLGSAAPMLACILPMMNFLLF